MYGYNRNYFYNYQQGNQNFRRGGRPPLNSSSPLPGTSFMSPSGFRYGRTTQVHVQPYIFQPDINKNFVFGFPAPQNNSAPQNSSFPQNKSTPHNNSAPQNSSVPQNKSVRVNNNNNNTEILSNSLVQHSNNNNKRCHEDTNTDNANEPQNKKQMTHKNNGQPEINITAERSINDKITEAIWRYYQQYRQSDLQYRQKVDLRDALYAIVKDVFPYSGLYMVGSSMSGFATKTSDMDLCLMLSMNGIEGKKEAIEILITLQKAFRKCHFIKRSQLIRARVPILKFEDYESNTECDLNINNSVGIRNTHLLRYYAAMDWRVRPLVLYVKSWARFHDINDASKMTISSYSLCLMVIHYLQYGCNPPVLDSVQKLYPELFDYGDDIRNLRMNVRIEFKSQNSSSIGDLFLGFLQYYADFDYDQDVLSVRLGCKIPFHLLVNQMPLIDRKQWKCLKIEEPFDRSNTARSCYDPQTFTRIVRVFTKSAKKLKQIRHPKSILSVPF